MPPRKKINPEPEEEEQKTTKKTQKAKKGTQDILWSKHKSLIYGDSGTEPNSKIAAFDMDGTLITTKSGEKFPKTPKDWVFFDEKVVPKLHELNSKGFKIVIFTNQNGITKGYITEEQIKRKIEDIAKQIDLPLTVLMASSDDAFRKPCRTLWNFFTENLNGKEDVDLKKSFYCGDAAGRTKPKKDFIDTDLKFALNIGIKFQTPEEFFLGEKQKIPKVSFDPKKIPKIGSIFKDSNGNEVKPPKGVKEMIIFMGSPASGKSTFWKTHLANYTRVNQDTLKTREKCLKVTEEAMMNGENLVIDNTNPTARHRQLYIDLAKQYDYVVRGFVFDVEKNLAFHLNNLREVNSHRKHMSSRIPIIPIHVFFKNFEKPTLKEGFAEIKTVNFVAGPFENKDDEESFFSFVTGTK